MPHVNTVLGPIHPSQMGFTAMHEHVLWGPPGWEYDSKWWWSMPRVFEKCSTDLVDFRQLGGATFVDCSGIGLGRDIDMYVTLARTTGVHLVACTGFWADRGILGYFRVRDIDYLEELFVGELTKGMGTTGVKAGIIKVGNTSKQPMSALEKLTYRAAARAAKKTGAAVTTHGITAAREQFQILRDEGLDAERIIIGHCDAKYALDLERDKDLARQGAYVGYDHIGIEAWSPQPYAMPDSERVELVQAMLKAGHRDRLILSADVNSFSLGWSTTPLHTVGHLLRYFVPAMRAAGIDDDTITHLFVENPRRVLPMQ